ncbi:MAG: hypothetical protein DHS20C15_31910 [Planctomycetota bacterium]|nr:MAG: hypothetical protein DHS20C15_31910 [Planctomycetota bacterium]
MKSFVLILLACASLAVAANAQDPLVVQALGRIEKYEALEPDLAAGDADTAEYYLNQLGWAGKRLGAVSQQDDAHWIAAKKRYDTLWAKIEAKANTAGAAPAAGYDFDALVSLNKAINAAYENLKLLSVQHLADEFREKSIRKELADFGARLRDFPEGDENVEIVRGNLANFQKLFDIGMTQLNADRARAAAITAQLDVLSSKYASENRPGNLEHPFSEAQIRSWAIDMRRWREQEIPTDLVWLAEARGNSVVNQQKVSSLVNHVGGSWVRQLDDLEKLVRERIASDVLEGQRVSEFILETDPEDQNQILGRILGKGAFDENMMWLRAGEHAVAMARVYDATMEAPAVLGPTITDPAAPRPEFPDRDAQAAQVDRAITHLKQLAVQALDAVRLPKAASTDPELIAIAETTLANPDYEVGAWQRLVINLDRSRKVRREAWLKPGAVSTTISFYEYAWEEFQVTTVEEHEGQLWLFSNRLKHYESGDPTTPVGRWILSNRFELTPILPEHVGK